ncbi:hypothetical protein FHK65_04255 [Enterococcus faecium]|nr:hypothetical protein FHK65_04255 [Enterococcus faecium]
MVNFPFILLANSTNISGSTSFPILCTFLVHQFAFFGFESIPRTRFVRIFSRFQRVSISSFRPAVKPKPFDR